ncbi:MAG: RidA family protein [Devosia sp.]
MKTVQHFGAAKVPLTPAVRAGDYIFVSGQVPTDQAGRITDPTIEGQTQLVLEKMAALLELAGASMSQIVKVNVFLADARDFGAFNVVYAKAFSELPPARTTSEGQLMIPIKVEIDAIAYAPLGAGN